MPVLKGKNTPFEKIKDGLRRKIISTGNLMTVVIENSELQTRSKLQYRDLVVKFQISAWIYGLGLVEKMA